MEDFDLRKYLSENRLLKEEIDTFLNDNFDEVKAKIKNIPSKFKTMGDSKVATAADGERGIDISFDKEHMLSLFPEEDPFNEVESIEIAGKTVYYNDYLAEGKMLRAINRLIYRYYNDGDKYYEGYGTETAGPAHSFLVNANHPLKAMMNRLFREFISDGEYEKMLNSILNVILTHIESKQGEYTKNTLGGIFDYESEYEDDDEDYDDYYDEEEDYYQE